MATSSTDYQLPTGHASLRQPAAAPHPAGGGLLLGMLGVLVFSLSLPMTRLANTELPPLFVAFGRMAGAGLLAALIVVLLRVRRPTGREWRDVLWAAVGVVVGFPLLSTLAVKYVNASHAGVINGLLPFFTAMAAALLYRERLPRVFWLLCAMGTGLVCGFAWLAGGGTWNAGDALMLLAVLSAALGYAAGGVASRSLGAWQTICWALVLALPLAVPVALWLLQAQGPALRAAGLGAWSGFAYVTVMSQLLGFFAWYGGLARGGVARVGQIQLLQIFLTAAAAGLFFGEAVPWYLWLFAAAVVALIVLLRRTSALR
ncbi:MAG TPA: DMT family transporter [Burkholderiaceae bacterium]|nr:DMT family transporter [Burkholderiaceae bacterium]